MIGRIAKILIWILIAAWFAVIMGFVSAEADRVLCNRIDVILSDTLHNRFVTGGDIREILERSGVPLQGYAMAEINSRKLEGILEQNPYIRKAEVSKEVTGRLEVRIDQRVPLVRVLPRDGTGFYLDREGEVLPLSEQFTPLILLISGYIPLPGQKPLPENGLLQEIHTFCAYLADHPFWNDQIVQIYVDRRGEFELIPRVGAHQILLGTLEQWERKLSNLELLYRQGLSSHGWNTYGTINLKYTNQVICTKR